MRSVALRISARHERPAVCDQRSVSRPGRDDRGSGSGLRPARSQNAKRIRINTRAGRCSGAKRWSARGTPPRFSTCPFVLDAGLERWEFDPHRRGRGRRPTGRANPQPNWRGLWRKRVHFHSHGSSPDIRRPDSHTLDADPLALATLGHIMSASVRLRLLPPAAHRRLATLIKVALQSLELVPVGVGRRVGRERQLRAHQLLHALLVRRVERLELFALAPRVGCELAQVLRRRVGATV